MATICQTHGGGLNQCHLRSIGRKASVSGVAEVIHFYKAVTLIGRNKDVVDYFVSCPVSERRDYISRTHARVIRTNDTYRLVDSSLTGVYVNDVRINGTVSLQEGDTVTFGHPAGNGIRPGTRVRQPNSEFYFLFEHCYCRIDQLRSARGEVRNSLPQIQLPLLTSPEVPPVYNSGLVFENNVGLPIISQLARTSQVVQNSGAPPKSSTRCGDMQPPTVSVTLPLTSAGPVLSSVKSSLCTNSVNVTSNKLEMPATSTSTATPNTSLEDYTRPNSQIVRSASPEYVHRKGSTVTAEPSQQSVFETVQSSLFRENATRTAELANSDSPCVKPSGAQACNSESIPKFYRPFLDEGQDSGEIATQLPAVTCYNREPSPPFPHSRDAVETHDSDPSGRAIVRTSLSDNTLDLSDSFLVESGGNLDSRPLAPVADKSVLGSCANSDNDDVMMEISVINSTEETAKHETSGSSEPYIQMQVTEVINEAMKNVQVPSVTGYKVNLMEKERSTEEENRYSLEQRIVDVCVHETPCVAVSVTGAETCESHSKKKDSLPVNSLSELVIGAVENCLENSDCITINIVPEDIALGKDPDGRSPAKEVVSPKKLVNADGKTCVEELGLSSETAMTIDRTREVSISFVPDLELPHSVWHSGIKNEICKDKLTSVIKQNSLMPNEEAIKESSDIVESDSCSLADRELETLNNILDMETQKPETTLDIQEGAESSNDKIMTISNREVREMHRDHVFEEKLQNALDQDYMLSDTGIINLEHQNSSNVRKVRTVYAAKEMSSSECDIGSDKSQEKEDDSVSGVALFQSSVTEQVVSRASGTKIVQCQDVPHSEEEESSVASHVAVDGLVTKMLQNNPEPTAPENLSLCAQNISDYHVSSPSKHHILSKDIYLEDVTNDSSCNCMPSSSRSLPSENSPHQSAPKEEESCKSGAVVKPVSGTFCGLQATVIEMTSPEYPCRYEDSGAFTSAKRSISETMSQEMNVQSLSQNEPETSVKQNACNKANISHATVCIESEGFQSDHVYMITSVSTKGVPQEVSDLGIHKIHLEGSASEGDKEQTDMNVNGISLTMDSHVRYGDKDESESKMDSMNTEMRISSVTDCAEISYAEAGTQTRLINERAINLLATKPAVNGIKNSVSNTSICEEEVNMSVDTHLSLQQFSEAYERTILDNNASKNSWREVSKQMELDSKAEEKLPSEPWLETFEGKTLFVASCSSPNKVTFLENTQKSVEVMNPESPIDVGEEFPDRCLLQKSDCTLERKRSPGKEEEGSYISVFSSNSLSTTNTKCIKTVGILVSHTLVSTLNDNNEMHDTNCQELKTACSVVDDTASGEQQLDQSASIENTFCIKTDEDSVESKVIMKIPGERHDSGTAINDSIFEQQKNIKNKSIDKEMEIMANVCVGQTNLNHSSITEGPTNRLEGNTAYYSSELEGVTADDLSPLCLSKQTSLVMERSSDFNDYFCSQRQSPYSVNKRDMGNNPEPINDYVLPQQDTWNEEDMKLNDENRVEAVNHKWSVKSVTLEKDKVEFKHTDAHFSELDLGTLNNYLEDSKNSSVSSAHLELRQPSSAFRDPQETDSHAGESQYLESNIDLKSEEDPVKKSLYPEDFVIDSDLKKLCEQNMTIEILTPTGLEKSIQNSICQEEGGIRLQTSEMDTQPCSVDRNDLAVGMQAVAFGKPESAKENIAENLLKEIETDPTEGSELFSAEELNLYISDSEVENEKKEENSMRMKNATEMQYERSKILKEKDTVICDPDSVSDSIILQANLDCKPNEDQLGRVIETDDMKSMIGTEKSTDMSLEEKSYSFCNADYDLSEVRIAGPENCSTGVVVGEFCHLVKSPTLREEKTEDQATAEHEFGPLCCPYNSIEFPCVPGSQREMEAVKGIAEVGLNKGDAGCSDEHVGSADSNSIQAGKNLENPEPENRLLDGCIQELDVGTPAAPLGALNTVKDSPVNEMLTSLCAEKDEFNQKTETNELVYMQQESKDSEPLKSQAKICQPTGCADFSKGSNEGLTVSESNFMNRMESHKEENKDSQNKEANKNNSFRTLKRHISRTENSGTSVSEDEQCSQKRNCPLGSLSMQQSVSDLPSPNVILFSIPTDLKECHDRFVSSSVKQFFKKKPILQTAQHLDEMEKESSKNIAQLVREFFKKTNDSENPVDENIKPERCVPPIESKAEEDTDCKSVGEVDHDDLTRRDGSSLLLFSSIEPLVNGKRSVKLISESQSLPLDSQFGFTELAASSADSWTDVLEKDVVSKIPESPSADSLSEEEQFQSRMYLALDNQYSSDKSPLKSPDVDSEQSTKIKDLDFIFSDTSNSSVESESEHHQLTQRLNSGSSSGTGGLHEGICSDNCKAAGLDTQSGFSCNSLEASAVYWSDDDTNITSDLIATSGESSQCVTSNFPQQLESEDHVESIKDKKYMPVLHRAERRLDGVKTPNIEDLSVPAFCVNSITGAVPSSQKITLKVESDADQHEVPEFDAHNNIQNSEISCLQTKSACSPFKDLRPAATVDWNINSPIQEQITSHVRLGVNSQMQLKRKLSHEEHDDTGNRSSISPLSKMCHPVVAISSESADEEPAPNQKEIGTPDALGSCSTSQTSLTERVTQTPSKSEAKHSLSLQTLKNSYASIPPSAVKVGSASQKAVDSNVRRCIQSSYFNSQLELSSFKLPPPEASDSAEVINSRHERTDKEEDFAEDNQHGDQQNQKGQTNLYDYIDGRIASEPCIAVGLKEPSDLQTTNDFSSLSNVPKLEVMDLSRSALNNLACEPAPFPAFKEENLQCSLQVQTLSDTSDHCSPDFREYPTTLVPVISTLHKCGASETSVSSLPDHSFQPMSVAHLQIRDMVLSPCKFSQQALKHVCSSDEASCHSEDLGEDMEEFPSMSTESSSVIGLLSETKNLGNLSNAETSAPKASSSNTNIMESELQKAWALSEGDIEFQLSQCQTVLDEISQTLCAVEGIDEVHMEEWREQIEKLQKDTKMPKTYIAVVGNTGAGKSSLLNALLDEEAVLPTSAMRACTAVVVEISKTGGKSLYEADVEFLSKEEWDNELKALLEDMKDKSGNLKKRCPDRKTEAGAAYSRVKAVYGTIAELPKLIEMKEVTQHLGTVKHISAEKAADFRTKIEKFIDSRTDNLRDMKGGEFWPIVKCVKIRVPGADVLKTGAVLVDLPGIRDSNAARDNAAKEYLKNCNAVWVVANITRAVDDKTAKEMLSANLRRQLLMDGQYGSLAFVCTKTDSFNVTEIMSDLDLRDEIQPIEKSLEELENQRVQMEMEKDTLYAQLQQEQQQGPGAENPASFQKENDLRKKILEKEFRISNLQREKDMKLRDISLICVQSRNRFSKQRIWVDFNNGLQEMRRKAAFAEDDEDEEEEETEDEELTTSDTSDPGEVESQHGKLQVFTVSSTEYLKLHGKLLRDGQPQVFHNEEDTEIPALKKFAIHTALQHGMVATEKVIRNVARVISQVVNYLTNQRAEDNSHQAQIQEIVQECLARLPMLLQEAVEDSLHDIQYYFSVLILANLKKGARRAEELCEDKVRSWGLPGIGYPYATYRAVCARQGVYSSVACGFVDFNEQLTEPISSAISMTWNEVFSCKLGESITQFSKAILDKLKYFFKDLKNKLREKGRNTEPVNIIQRHQMEAVQALLCNFLLDQMEYINKRQRGISRVLTPEIQASMKQTYAACSQVNGPGSFQRMKDLMQRHVRNQKETMFNCVTDKLRHQLDLLQVYIGGSFECLVQELTKSLTLQFEPVLKPVQKNDGIIPDLVNICAKVSKICKISRVDYVLPNLSQTESCSVPASPGKELPLKRELREGLDPPDFLGKCNIIRIGTMSLSHINPIQISMQDVTVTMTDNTTMTLPFSSVYLCECCFHLYYLILHLSPALAKNIYSRLGAQASNPSNQEALIILDKPQDPSSFHSLIEFISARHGGIPWFRELNLQQGREKLESLGVYYTVKDLKYDDEEKALEVPPSSLPSDQPTIFTTAQQPLLPGMKLYPYGRKRGGGEIQSQLEKKHKGKTIEQSSEVDPVGFHLPSQHIPGRLVSARKSMASHPQNASGECASAFYKLNTTSISGTSVSEAPPSSHVTVKDERDLFTIPSAAGILHVRAKEGVWGKWRSPNAQEDNSSDVDKMETNGNMHTAKDSWNPH
ncbi:nuclear GTPase SLIP-GC isoform X2 [Gopherus flavomarginatus]|uniref:nuclear GTPase SLIP-GC isoform X2 n=1 Tax=Gopherus flavomarginatus TaxID=286002 RepID=UPI0021CBCEA7|nr:nuclear GTPase SLIP-GC isoform X2 [Gopherus flavomarginatus]